ncbi:MAG: glutamate--tRNA ligase family protein [Nanoarchaeota archaeon]
MKSLEEKARAYALKNALAHEGKANQGSVISSLFHEGLKKDEVSKYIKTISKIVSEVNSMDLEKQKIEFEKLEKIVSERKGREGLAELPNVGKKGVIMRFAPSPSGPLHIGHAMTSSLSYLYVKKYGGKLIIRIEDTNPENIYPLAYKMIENEMNWLFKKDVEFHIQSYRMEIYYNYVEKLLKKDAIYVCTCHPNVFEKFVLAKKNCPCKNIDKKLNLIRWKKMLDKNGFEPGEAVVRFKSDMKHPNPAMRDFPLLRINIAKHPIQKNKYRVWPLMNFAVAVDDLEMKITHIIRAKDHIDNARRQELIFKVLGKKSPWTGFLGRFKFTDLEISKTKMRQAIEEGKYTGWDDPRLPTLEAMKKKYKPEAFWKFAEQIGLSESDKIMDKKEFFTLLDSFNKS